ncbi:PREDICTED: MATH and LRR domain-containing protein PFE0570w-like [Trachymyrmex cornetzi]|uniref:Replicase polyprotein 1ab n=1 Tax=Trachymyrmex cornetzi TaxID=471704 RepID=A0A195E568_9HYME|nr:PREDICTED: MATH and LRR domain-containing protein PFE0570w-like [Trachymyrmex cornetzi]KYN20231.1 Replicase polyprotein 1ab [Trachymyrmex cornetzi]
MSRSVKDSDDDFEPKSSIGRMQTRMFTVQSVNSPLRRSSRIKQNKYSPSSESDSSISSTQTTQSAIIQATTMDSTVSDTMKKLRTRKHSVSSEISEIDIDVPPTSVKRSTRQSSGATSLVGTPTKVNTRATSKRFMRAGSETKSPLPATRTTRQTRARSIDPESSTVNKNQSSSPTKTRRRASMLPLSSQIQEQTELNDRIPYVRLDSTIVETDEITNSGNSDSSPDIQLQRLHQIKRKLQNINKDQIEEDYSHENVETSTDSSKSAETLQLSEKEDATQTEDITRETAKNTENTLDKEQKKFEETLPSDKSTIEEFSTYSSPSHRNSAKEDTKIVENLSDVEKSLLDICGSNKEMEVMPENLSGTSIEKEKSNKENQMLNIISDVAEKLMQPKPASSIKSFTSPFMDKLLSEKETKSMKKEVNLNKRLHSRESTEVAIKYSDLSKETIDNSQEKMDISIESINSNASDKTILLHESTEVADKVTNKDEISTENTSACNEDAMEIISELEKTDTKECTITDNQNSNKSESNEVDKTSRLSINLVKSKQTSDSRESLTSIITMDDNEIKLVLEERSPRRNDNEVSPNVAHSKPDQSVDSQISSPINKTSTDSATVIDKQSALTQDKIIIIDSSDSIEQEEENSLKQEIESTTSQSSNIVLETNNSVNNSNDTIIQDNQLTDVIEASKKSTMDISFEKTDSKGVLSEKVKPNLKRKSTDNLEGEKESLQMETSQKDQENINVVDDVSDVDAGINLFQDIPADKWKEKDDVKTGSVQSTSQLVEEVENENEAEHDLILVDKQAWLAAETIKAAKEAESFEYDSDDTVLLKSRLDSFASQANYEKLATVDEELTLDIDPNEKNEKQVKKRKSRTKKRLVSEIDEDISRYAEDEDNLIPVDKSLNESKTALNRTNDRSISRLNKSEQSEKTKRRSSKASNESEKEIDDANELNRNSLISKNDISSRKSTGERTSLNKSSKDISMPNISPNKSQTDNSEKELDDTAASTRKKLYKKKHSLEQSCNKDTDDNATESENKNVATEDCSKKHENTSLNYSADQESESLVVRKIIHLNESDDSDIDVNVVAMDLGSKTSMIANMGSDSDECEIPEYLFSKAISESNTDDSNGYSDSLNREYNLDGLELKFSDDDVAADECRDSEVEFSDSDDNGSDLQDFIIDDIETENDDEEDNDTGAENEEEENDEEDSDIEAENDDEEDNDTGAENEKEENAEEDNDIEAENDDEEDNEDDDNAVQKEKVEDEKEKANFNTELINIENENVQKKDTADKDTNQNKFIEMEAVSLYASTSHKLSKTHENNNKSIEHISPCKSETETTQEVKKKKSNMKKNKKLILQDSSNSDLSIKKKKKKKSLVKENETVPLSTCNIIASALKSILDPQYSKDGAEQLNEFKSLTLHEDSLKKFKDANKKEISSDFSLLPDLMKKVQDFTFPPKSPKISSRKTMNIDIETPRLKYLRKEKLNESAPTRLEYSSETNSLQKQLSAEKDTTQIKIKKKNKDKVHDLIIPSNDDVIQKCSQKKQKKRKRQDSSNKNMSDKVLSEDVTELNVPKKKKIKLTPLTIVEDNIHKDTCETNKKKKKKNKLKENITDKAKNAIELNVSKKKKPVKLTQLSTVEDNTLEDVSLSHSNERKLKQSVLMNYIVREVWSKDITKLNRLKKKKHDKFAQLPVVEDNIPEDVCQINERKKKKKNRDISKENVIDKSLSTDVIEIKIPKKKKRAKLTQLSIVENAREEACQINKIKKNKKQINIVEENTNVNKDNMLRNIRGNKTELPQYKKKNKVVNSLELDLLTDEQVKKKIKRQETVESIETLQTEKKKKKKKKKEEDVLSIEIPVSKLKSEKILPSKLRLQKTALGMSKSKNVAYNTKELDETDAKVYTEESRSKKKRNQNEDVENAIYMNIPKKSKKEVKERNFLPPSSGLKRLPDDVIENLVDVPTKAKKRQKTSRGKEKIVSSTTTGKVKVTTADRDNTLNTSGCTTQFRVVNLQKTKKQPLKGAAAAASFRERMLTRNSREPMSSYLMFCDKMSHPK